MPADEGGRQRAKIRDEEFSHRRFCGRRQGKEKSAPVIPAGETTWARNSARFESSAQVRASDGALLCRRLRVFSAQLRRYRRQLLAVALQSRLAGPGPLEIVA